jgi:hypothetical protein
MLSPPKRKLLLFGLGFVVACPILWICGGWISTEIWIRQIVTTVDKEPDVDDIIRMRDYVEGNFWSRPPGWPLSQKRQADIAHYCVLRPRIGSPQVFVPVVSKWRYSDLYRSLPDEINRFLRIDEFRSGMLLADAFTVAGPDWKSSEGIGDHIDFEYIWMHARETGLLCLTAINAPPEVIRRNRSVFCGVLSREDVREVAKKKFRRRIERLDQGHLWFSDEDEFPTTQPEQTR